MSRAALRMGQGVLIAAGAPLGWLLIQRLNGVSAAGEIAAHAGLYAYMLGGTTIVFGIFGLLLGQREDRLLVANSELQHLAITDPLTGLHNPRYFYERLDEEQAERFRTGHPLSLIIIDLDYFKRVNDEYGHLVGDDVLSNTAHAIASVTRGGETAARVGGEEFAILLPASTAEAAHEVAERARRAIAAKETRVPGMAGKTLRVAASAGVASTADHPDATALELYRAADEALYRAKAEGRDRTVVSRRTG